MAYSKMKLKNGGKMKAKSEDKNLRRKIFDAKMSGKIKDYLYNGTEKGSVKKKKK